MRVLFLVPLSLCLAACSNDTATIEDFNSQTVTLPDGTKVKAEVMMNPKDMMRGMMFRDTFPEGSAMLFVHGRSDESTVLDVPGEGSARYRVDGQESSRSRDGGKRAALQDGEGQRMSELRRESNVTRSSSSCQAATPESTAFEKAKFCSSEILMDRTQFEVPAGAGSLGRCRRSILRSSA